MSDESDPSDDDQLAERAIDPLADLREELQEDATDQAADDTADTQSSTTAEQPPVADSASSTEQQSEDGPLGELASTVSTRANRTDKTDAELEELFEQQETASVDPDAVWEQLEADDTSEADETPVQTEPRVVEKATYCESCPYFSAPPDMYCTHDGTEIRRLVDFDHVEVVNCPIVKQNDELENA